MVFEVMMMSQRTLSRRCELPARIKKPRNSYLVDLFEEKNWKWCDGGDTHGKNFISNLRDTLWYVDGHHATLKAQSCPIPESFDKFEGYSVSEKSKHRKHAIGNLSFDVIVNNTEGKSNI